jgi:hypothetical protein
MSNKYFEIDDEGKKLFISTIDTDVADSDIRTALPEKTFLEKVFLLHEIFVTTRCQRAESSLPMSKPH